MKILITPDVPDWAIGALTHSIARHANRFNIQVTPVHPRDYTPGAINIRIDMKKNGKYDLWHCMYFNSGKQLLDSLAEIKDIPSVLTHTNHDKLEKEDWSHYEAQVVATNWAIDKLKGKYGDKVKKIPYGIDLERFSFIDERKDDGKTIGYVGRVVPWKHLGDITLSAKKLGYRVLGSGYVDKPDYWNTVDKEVLTFHGGTGRREMSDMAFKDNLYEQMTVFVMYSTGEYESGTLPLLEAMARGIPVMATSQGMARDLIEDGKNGFIFTEENFEEKLKELVENKDLQERFRQEAWKTIKNYSEEWMSLEYQKLSARILAKCKPTISIVIPTKNRADQLLDSLVAIEEQNYPYAEVIVCDDGSDDPLVRKIVMEAKKQMRTPILYTRTSEGKHYGLAHARNVGVAEAIGDIVVFLDDRLRLSPGALDAIAASDPEAKTFYHGAKLAGGLVSTKRAFIENFSWCLRSEIINAGLWPEWLRMYGGMSQEIRSRLNAQGWKFEYKPEAIAGAMTDSPRHGRKSDTWKSKLLLRKLYG